MNNEEEKEAKKVAPWWRYAEDYFRPVYATDIARIAPTTPWEYDAALRSASLGPAYEVGEDKIGIPIPGLVYGRNGDGTRGVRKPATFDATLVVSGVKPVVGTIPAVPDKPFVAPPLEEYEEGIELIQRLSATHIAAITRTMLSLDEDEAKRTRSAARFIGVTVSVLKAWLAKREGRGAKLSPKWGKEAVDVKTEIDDDNDTTLANLRVWILHEVSERVVAIQDDLNKAANAAAIKSEDIQKLVLPENGTPEISMSLGLGLVSVPSNVSVQQLLPSTAPKCEEFVDALPSSATTTVTIGEEQFGEETEEDEDTRERTIHGCRRAFGTEGELRHVGLLSTIEAIPTHTQLLFDRQSTLPDWSEESDKGLPSTSSKKKMSGKNSTADAACEVCAKLKTLAHKCGKSGSSVNCLKRAVKEEILLPGMPSSSKPRKVPYKVSVARDELAKLENAFSAYPVLFACAPVDEVEGEILAHQYELLWNLQANKHNVKNLIEKVAKSIDEDTKAHTERKLKLDEANAFMGAIREVKRQQKKEKREAEQRAALERANASAPEGRRESKPKREIGSAAITSEPTVVPTGYKPLSTQTVLRAIEAAPARVKKMFGLANFDGTASHLKSLGWPGTPRSNSPVLGGSPIRSPMSQILLDPFHSIGDNTACCVCAGTSDASKTKTTIKCSMCDLVVHPSCYGVPGKVDSKWKCWVCVDALATGRATDSRQSGKSVHITLQGKLALYKGVSCSLCPVQIGALKQTLDGKQWCHVACAKWVPEASIVEKNAAKAVKPVSINDVPRERRNASCSYCTRSHGTLMRCCSGHCQIVFHPLCCRRAACHMRSVDSQGRQFTAFCEKHSGAERLKDVEAGLTGDPIPALVELYNQQPLERQLSGGLPGIGAGTSMHGALQRVRETMRANKRDAGELPTSSKGGSKKSRGNFRQSSMLPGNLPSRSGSFASMDGSGNPVPGGGIRRPGGLRGGILKRDALLSAPDVERANNVLPPGYKYVARSDVMPR